MSAIAELALERVQVEAWGDIVALELTQVKMSCPRGGQRDRAKVDASVAQIELTNPPANNTAQVGEVSRKSSKVGVEVVERRRFIEEGSRNRSRHLTVHTEVEVVQVGRTSSHDKAGELVTVAVEVQARVHRTKVGKVKLASKVVEGHTERYR